MVMSVVVLTSLPPPGVGNVASDSQLPETAKLAAELKQAWRQSSQCFQDLVFFIILVL
jgi:hypothetical protein